MSQTISARAAELGLTLETPASPAANYVSSVRVGNLVHISGQIARQGGNVVHPGRLGAEVTEEDGIEAARLSALGVLAQIAAVADDKIDRVARIVKLGVFVASAPGFSRQSIVANGASDLMVQVFGETGRHARSAVGVAMLPSNAPVEVEAVIALHEH
jgi:enamine deaminase RidA (YjgF/YER057c/UK114 family)